MNELLSWRKEEGHFENIRVMQAGFWFEEDVKQGLLARLREKMRNMMSLFAIDVEEGKLLPSQAARELFPAFKIRNDSSDFGDNPAKNVEHYIEYMIFAFNKINYSTRELSGLT